MRNAATMVATLLAMVSPAWAQQDGKDKATAPETCEIRAYLLNKERETINIVDITAILVVEGKEGADVLIPLQVVTTKTGEKNALRSSRAPRELEGTAYFVSLVTVHPDGSRRSEASDADRRLAKGLAQDLDGKQPVSPAESDKRFTLEGPYFKADVTREQLAAFTCQASVRFTIKKAVHTAKGFSCALSKGTLTQGAMCKRVAGDILQVERHVKASEMDKAKAVVDRMSASLCDPCSEAACQRERHGCASCCKDLRAAISVGNREKALEALEALKAKCSPCLETPKPEPKSNVGSK